MTPGGNLFHKGQARLTSSAQPLSQRLTELYVSDPHGGVCLLQYLLDEDTREPTRDAGQQNSPHANHG